MPASPPLRAATAHARALRAREVLIARARGPEPQDVGEAGLPGGVGDLGRHGGEPQLDPVALGDKEHLPNAEGARCARPGRGSDVADAMTPS